jgi:hypothetical protein
MPKKLSRAMTLGPHAPASLRKCRWLAARYGRIMVTSVYTLHMSHFRPTLVMPP